jgi:hypothetical protein
MEVESCSFEKEIAPLSISSGRGKKNADDAEKS